MSYSTPAQVVDQALSRLLTGSGWSTTTDVQTRITEADTVIDTRLAQAGYALPFTSVPPMVLQLSIWYARYAVLRDLYQGQAPSISSLTGQKPNHEAFKDRFDEYFDELQNGKAFLVYSTGGVVPRTNLQILEAGSSVVRILTMDDPTNLSQTVDESYLDSDAIGAAPPATPEDSGGTNNAI